MTYINATVVDTNPSTYLADKTTIKTVVVVVSGEYATTTVEGLITRQYWDETFTASK